jgi:hypothetical protein
VKPFQLGLAERFAVEETLRRQVSTGLRIIVTGLKPTLKASLKGHIIMKLIVQNRRLLKEALICA